MNLFMQPNQPTHPLINSLGVLVLLPLLGVAPGR